MSWVPAREHPLGGLSASGWARAAQQACSHVQIMSPDISARQASSRQASDFICTQSLGGPGELRE